MTDKKARADGALFTPPVPLIRKGLGAPARPGVYVIECGGVVAHIGMSSNVQNRIRTMAALGNHRGSAKVLCAAYCSGEAPTVRWRATESVAQARAVESEMHQAYGNGRGGCERGEALKSAMVAAAGDSPDAGYVEAVFDIGEQLSRLFSVRFDRVWAEVGRPPGPWNE